LPVIAVTTRVVARRVVVNGRVQGVFFRDTCRREAVAAGVSGWIRNCYGGEVEAWLEGDTMAVERVVAWCRRGPSRAEVIDVEVHDEEPRGLRGFVVR
jgi:acylphosphatase